MGPAARGSAERRDGRDHRGSRRLDSRDLLDGQVYAEAKEASGDSELLNEIVSAKPEADTSHYDSPEEFKEACLKSLRDAVKLLDEKATREELEDYKKFVLILADRAANARKEGFMGMSGERVSDAEREAIGEIAAALA